MDSSGSDTSGLREREPILRRNGGEGVACPRREQSLRQVQSILRSAAFRNAHTLQQLLEFLVSQAYGPDSEALKEYTIGIGVFSRPQDFDPKTDPIVRVQTHRLRQKLKEYYSSEGKHDSILIEIPKGHYLPTFESMARLENGIKADGPAEKAEYEAADVDPGAAHALNRSSAKKAAPAGPEGRRFRTFVSRQTAVVSMTIIAVFAAGLWLGSMLHRSSANLASASASSELSFNPATKPVRAFWADLLGNDSSPIIAHADAVYLLDSHNDLFWFPHGASDYRGAPVDPHLAQQFAADPALVAKAGKLYYENVYLGSGDLDAVGALSNLFGQMGLKAVIEPGKDVTPEDLAQHNVILVGSSFQSYAVSQFNSVGDFTFVNPDPKLGGWLGIIENSHPRPGEQSVYRTERDAATGVLTVDHALITVQPGVAPGRYIADLGGLDTTGSAGAARFATSIEGVEALKKALDAEGIRGVNGGPPLFQALLSIRLEKGSEVLGTSLIAVHPLSPAQKVSPSAKAAKSSPTQ